MADTIVNTPTERSSDSSAGWAVAIVVLIAVVVIGGLYLYYHRGYAAPAANPATTVQVNLPSTGNTGASGGTSAPAAPAGGTGY